MVSPFILSFLLLGIFPLVTGGYLSMTNFTGFNMEHVRFVGATNYQRVLNDPTAMYSLGRTFLLGVIIMPIGLIVSFLLAVLLIRDVKGLGVYRTLYYLPSIVPFVAAGVMWKMMFSQSADGILNALLGVFGVEPVFWLDPDHVTLALVIMCAWGAGGNVLINIAGLKNIPLELYESAEIDGASPLRKMWSITLPIFTPILYFNFLMGVIGMLQMFIQPLMLANSGEGLLAVPYKPIYTFLVHIYQQVFGSQRFGYGLAMSWIVTLLILVMTVVVRKSSEYWVHYENEQKGG